MKRFVTFFAILCWVLLTVFAFGQQTQQGKPKMVIEKPTHDAGSMYRGGEKNMIEHVFIIKNTGAADLQILKAQPG